MKRYKAILSTVFLFLFWITAYSQTTTVEWNDLKQTIDGFGVCDAWRSDDLEVHPNRTAIMDLLFKINGGAGFSILRHRIDPEFVTGVGSYNWSESDFQGNVWTATQALNRDCEKVWAVAWTPPAFWKTNNSEKNGGFLQSSHYQNWANALEAYYQRMKNNHSITYYAISAQNEPGKKSWESCEWNRNDLRDWIKNNLGPTLNTRLIAPEATRWDNSTHSDDVEYWYTPINNDATARGYVDILGGHCYPTSNIDHKQENYGKTVWMTEWSYDTSSEDVSIDNGVTWAYNWWRLLANAEVNSVHFWWAVNMNENGRQGGLITATPGVSGYTVAKRLYTLGNYSKFVRPGWKQIDAQKNPTSNVYFTAFKNESNNKFALVVVNTSTSSRSLTINFDGFTCSSVTPHRTSSTQNLSQLSNISAGSSFSVSLPGKTVTTYTGTASTGSGSDLSGWWYLRNKDNNYYLDTGSGGVVKGQASFSSGYDRQWRFVASSSHYNIDNRKSGRGVLDTGSNNVVTYKTSEPVVVSDDKLWEMIVVNAANNEYRILNKKAGRYYLRGNYGTITWNAGGTGDQTVWILESASAAKRMTEEKVIAAPTHFRLESNYPNPFNPTTNIDYTLPASGDVLLEVFDIAGRKVRTLVSELQSAGTHSIQWNACNHLGERVNSGVYMYRIYVKSEGGEIFEENNKMILLK